MYRSIGEVTDQDMLAPDCSPPTSDFSGEVCLNHRDRTYLERERMCSWAVLAEKMAAAAS